MAGVRAAAACAPDFSELTVANRVLSVGDPKRAELIAEQLDGGLAACFRLATNRGFITHTGTYRGVPVTVCATGMGVAMVDFLVRELLAVLDGTLVIARFGTCGTPQPHVPLGTIAVATGGNKRACVCVCVRAMSHVRALRRCHIVPSQRERLGVPQPRAAVLGDARTRTG